MVMPDGKEETCDMDHLFQMLGSRWNLLIIWHLRNKVLRFTELKRLMDDVNSKTITVHLRELETFHIVRRVAYPEVPPRVEYSLTEHGEAIIPLFSAMKKWGISLPPPGR